MTKIILEYPYSQHWSKGYLVVNKEPRRNVVLYNSDKDRSTVSYARYLMSVHLGRYLDKGEFVDHINNDQMDDRIDNYQILDAGQNMEKGLVHNGRTRLMVEFNCGVCGKNFVRPKNRTHLTIKEKRSTFCSRSCGGKAKGKAQSLVKREFRR